MGTIRIGISGWRYAPWRGSFYPDDLAQRRELEYVAERFASVELNGSFYSLQSPKLYKRWHDETPNGFVFAIKGSRFITHVLRLKDIEQPLANFFASGLFELKDKLGPFLWQFPPRMVYDEARFETFFRLLPKTAAQAEALARKSRDVYAYFDNDVKVRAPYDARSLATLLGTADGLPPLARFRMPKGGWAKGLGPRASAEAETPRSRWPQFRKRAATAKGAAARRPARGRKTA